MSVSDFNEAASRRITAFIMAGGLCLTVAGTAVGGWITLRDQNNATIGHNIENTIRIDTLDRNMMQLQKEYQDTQADVRKDLSHISDQIGDLRVQIAKGTKWIR